MSDTSTKARVKCTDSLGNVAFIHFTKAWRCTLANGMPAAFSYAGILDKQEMALRFALAECVTPEEVLAAVKRYGCPPPHYRYELEGGQRASLASRLTDITREAQAAGYAITWWAPESLEGIDREAMLHAAVQAGNNYIDEHSPEEED